MVLLDVIIPPGLEGGDEMSVEHKGMTLTVTIPKALSSGDLMTLEHDEVDDDYECASTSQAHSAATEPMYINVPDGVYEGETFTVETEWGGLFDVSCPPGCPPGSTIVVELPVAPPGSPGESFSRRGISQQQQQHEQQEQPDEPPLLPPASPHRSPSPSQRSRRVARASREPPPPAPECFGHRYAAGSKVQVLRTDGTYSAATVCSSYEGVFDVLYQVVMDESGLYKQAVPEDEMFSATEVDDNFGAHLQAQMEAMMEAEMLDSQFGMECND